MKKRTEQFFRNKIPGKGSRDKDTEKHKTKPKLQYLMEETNPITKTNTVKKAAEKMLEHREKRLPVINPGTKKLEGDLRALDILDLFGGGIKTSIIEEKFKGNISEALNLKIKKIMNQKTLSKDTDTTLHKILEELKKKGQDTVYLTEENKVKGKIDEEKLVNLISSAEGKKKVKEAMTKEVITGGPTYKIDDTCKIMVRNNFNRLPIVSEHRLKGIVTHSDLLKYFSEEMFDLALATTEHRVFEVIIENIMTKNPTTTKPEETLHQAAEKMKETNHGGLPVTKNKKLKGILTRRDIIKVIK